jgi:hypothetical protein
MIIESTPVKIQEEKSRKVKEIKYTKQEHCFAKMYLMLDKIKIETNETTAKIGYLENQTESCHRLDYRWDIKTVTEGETSVEEFKKLITEEIITLNCLLEYSPCVEEEIEKVIIEITETEIIEFIMKNRPKLKILRQIYETNEEMTSDIINKIKQRETEDIKKLVGMFKNCGLIIHSDILEMVVKKIDPSFSGYNISDYITFLKDKDEQIIVPILEELLTEQLKVEKKKLKEYENLVKCLNPVLMIKRLENKE